MGIGTDTGTEGGHGEYIRYSSVIPCFSGCTRYPLPLSLPLPLCIPLWFPSSFFLFPLVVFLSSVILLLPCIPCLSPASSHPPIHSLIRLHGYPFVITDNRLTGPPHTPDMPSPENWKVLPQITRGLPQTRHQSGFGGRSGCFLCFARKRSIRLSEKRNGSDGSKRGEKKGECFLKTGQSIRNCNFRHENKTVRGGRRKNMEF